MVKINLNWINNKTLTKKEKEEVEEYCKKYRNVEYHHPVRRNHG